MQKTAVIDLDGTLLTINTFKSYILFVNKLACRKARLDIAVILAFWVGLRKCRLITHEKMKLHILKYSAHFMNRKRLNDFVDSILPFRNGKVYECALAYRKQGFFLCLSTAAPVSYASLIAERLSFDSVCATPMPSQVKDWRENVREIKRKNTLKQLGEHHLVLEILMTDHYDDIPLLKEEKSKNIVVSPTACTLEKLEKENIHFELLK